MSECTRTQGKSHGMANKPVCLVFGSAEMTDHAFVSRYIPEDGNYIVLCADGGLSNAQRAGLPVHVLVGDGDSGGTDCPEGAQCIRLPREKDQTDLQACLEYGLHEGMRDFVLLGCTGGRLDHFFGNVFLLEYLCAKGARGMVADACNEIRYLPPGDMTFADNGGFSYLSVIALDRSVSGITLEGLCYPLVNATVLRGQTVGISNEPSGEKPVRVHTEQGAALIIRSRDKT